MTDDAAAVRRLLASESWTKPTDDEYVAEVVARMDELRRKHPDGEFPTPIHGIDETGACVECDARKALDLT